MLKEFREFALKGSVLDLAIGIVIGVAFGRVVASFVSDVLMPPIGYLFGGIDFSNLFVTLSPGTYPSLAAAKAAGAATINYGLFVNTVIEFLIVALALFLVVKAVNAMRRREEAAPSAPDRKACPYCLTSVPVSATRCPACTSAIEEPRAA
jgi:large conductance mechanosensitive channel